ncbi:hypothetical protein OC835_003641 [Tilletia horrida]|nr:hypothetical protein OC835_003641 [Tilletia horrida]
MSASPPPPTAPAASAAHALGAGGGAGSATAMLSSSIENTEADDAHARFELGHVLDPAITASASSAVRCTEAYESNLYIGTSDGQLLWYTLTTNDGPSSSSSASQHYRLNSTVTVSALSKPVEKLILLPAISVAVVLCESLISFYELPSLQPIPPTTLPHIKAVATVVLDDAELIESGGVDTDGLVSLCIIKRKHIILAKVGRDRWVHIKEVPLPGGASIARRFRDQLCIATTSAYSLVHLSDATILPLGLPISQTTDSPSASVRPSILSIVAPPSSQRAAARGNSDDDCEFLITSHSENMTLGVFVRSNGEPAPKLIEWPSHPRALVLHGTHVFSLLRNDTVEVHDLSSMDKVGTLVLPPALEPRFLASAPPAPSVPGPSAWLCGKNAVHKVREVPLLRRAERLVRKELWDELRELADEAWEKQSRESIEVLTSRALGKQAQSHTRDLQRINQEVGFRFLQDVDFARARRYLSRGRLDPRTLIRMFKDVRRHVLDDDDEEVEADANVPGIEGGLQKGPRPWKTVDDLVRANLERNYSPPLDAAADPTLQRLSEALLARAKYDLLRGFLVDCRQQRRGEQREGRLGMDELTWRRVGMIIDIVLAKVYAAVGDLDELLAIMNEPGNESLEAEVERALRGSGQFGMLAGLLLKKGDQGGAMETVTELLARQDDPTVREQINLLLDSQSVQLDLPDILRDLHDDWSLSAPHSSGLHTFLRTRLRTQLHLRQEAQIVRALSLAQNLEVGEEVWGAMSRAERRLREKKAGAGAGGGGGGDSPVVVEDAGRVSNGAAVAGVHEVKAGGKKRANGGALVHGLEPAYVSKESAAAAGGK